MRRKVLKEASQKHYEVFQRNIEGLQALNGQEYPSLYKLFHRCTSLPKKLVTLMGFGISRKSLLTAFVNSDKLYIVRTLKSLAGCNEAEKSRWCKHISLLAALGLVERIRLLNHPFDELTKPAQKTLLFAVQQSQQGKKRHPTNWYHIPEYCDKILQEADERAKMWLDSKLALDSISKSTIIRVFGQDIADIAFDDYRIIGRDEIKNQEELTTAIKVELEKRGYAQHEKVIRRLRRNREKRSALFRIWSRAKQEILADLHAVWKQPTNAEKERWKLPNREYIIKKTEFENGHQDTKTHSRKGVDVRLD